MPQTGILYALVARGNVILAEVSGVQGNTSIIAIKILEKVNASANARSGDRLSYIIDDHAFHVLIAENQFIYLCMTEQSFGRRIPFIFLQDVQTRFMAAHGATAPSAAAYAFDHNFSPVLLERAAYHSDPLSDTLTRVTGEVSSLREVMVDNIEQLFERGERLELLVEKTEGLAENAFVFKRGATTLKRRMWWQHSRMTVGVAALVLAVFYLLAAMICSPSLKHC